LALDVGAGTRSDRCRFSSASSAILSVLCDWPSCRLLFVWLLPMLSLPERAPRLVFVLAAGLTRQRDARQREAAA